MVTLQRDYFLMLVGLGLHNKATTAAEREFADNTFKDASESLKSTNDFLDRHELAFPQPIREMIGELRRAMQLPSGAVRGILPGDEVLRRSQAVTTATEQIRAEILRLVGE